MAFNMNFLKQAQELQEKIKKMQEELVNKTATGSAGGDMVKVTVNGKHEVIDMKISKEVVDPEDIQMLANIRYRGRQPQTKEDWNFIYEAIVKSVGGK